MESEQFFEQLKIVLEKCGITIELHDLDDGEINIKSGLCEVGSRRKLIVDKKLPLRNQIELAVEILKSENLEEIFIQPAVRRSIETR